MKCDNCGCFNKPKAEVCDLCGNPTGLQVRVKVSAAKKPSRIKPVSEKRKEENSLYSLARQLWLWLHPICEFKGCQAPATEIHHKKGRIGYLDDWARQHNISLLIDIRKFMATCHDHHVINENDPEFAKKEGYSENRI